MWKHIWNGEEVEQLVEVKEVNIRFLKIRVGENYFLYITPTLDEEGNYRCTWTDESEFDDVFAGEKTREDFKEIQAEFLFNLV